MWESLCHKIEPLEYRETSHRESSQTSAPILLAHAVFVLGEVVLGVVVPGSQGAQSLALKARYLSFKPPDPINP
jgi:hypothetical protein